ncbi:MAG TPA: nitronate monooxygenase family protein [Solirubrobacterales bacterium]|nr:nitronate monooxygenase family protein [Solirubrobacterales bacterium]
MALRTALCDRLGIEAPIICAPFGPWRQVELAAAVSNAGGLGSLGTAVTPLPELREQWRRIRELTDRPFAINHTMRPFDEEAFAATLDEHPAVISFHLGVVPDLMHRAHEVGILWVQQVFNLDQAERALAGGTDVLIAQGGEAGGNGGEISTMAFVPQVVDMAGDTPVVAAGGIADGRGLAAALALGAAGVNLGTRFIASEEFGEDDFKRAVVEGSSADAVKVAFSDHVMPPLSPGGDPARPRALRTPFIDRWNDDPQGAAGARENLTAELRSAIAAGTIHELIPFAGQSTGLIDEVLPAAEIVRRLVAEAETAVARAAAATS